MSEAEELAREIRKQYREPASPFAIGFVQVPTGSSLAMVSGVGPDPIPIGRSSWSSIFAAQVAAGGVNGKRVTVYWVASQPQILTTMEDT